MYFIEQYAFLFIFLDIALLEMEGWRGNMMGNERRVYKKCWKEKKPYKNTYIFIVWKQKMKYSIKLSDIKNSLETNPSYYPKQTSNQNTQVIF